MYISLHKFLNVKILELLYLIVIMFFYNILRHSCMRGLCRHFDLHC